MKDLLREELCTIEKNIMTLCGSNISNEYFYLIDQFDKESIAISLFIIVMKYNIPVKDFPHKTIYELIQNHYVKVLEAMYKAKCFYEEGESYV